MDNLLAQVMAADESIAHKNEEIARLKKEKETAEATYDKTKSLLPVMKAQVGLMFVSTELMLASLGLPSF